MNIAGTRIEEAEDDDRQFTVLVSDLHIQAHGGEVLQRFSELVEDAARQPSPRLIVLGDLFDAYAGPKQARVGIWLDVCSRFARAAADGLSITVLHGNRDFMLDQSFADRASCRVVAGGLRLRLGGRSCLLLHGDELCQRDLPYQRAKRVLRHPVTRAVVRSLPLRVALGLADRARKRSATVVATGDQTRFDPVASAIREVFAGGTELLVFGHIHRPARGYFSSAGVAGDYAILPAFDREGVHLVHRDGRLAYHSLECGDVPDYPPREFR